MVSVSSALEARFSTTLSLPHSPEVHTSQTPLRLLMWSDTSMRVQRCDLIAMLE